MFEVGKLYSCPEYFLLLFPDKESLSSALGRAAIAATTVKSVDRGVLAGRRTARALGVAYWSKELGKPVSFCNPQTPFLVLSIEEKYVEVLIEDKKGWILAWDWLGIKEVQ